MNDKETQEIANKVFDKMMENRKQRHKEMDKSFGRTFSNLGNLIILTLLFAGIMVISKYVGIGVSVTTHNVPFSYTVVGAFALIFGLLASSFYDKNYIRKEEEDKK
jgi:hypothetical protein